LTEDSQSNIVVTVSELYSSGHPCPIEFTNALSNTNLFTPKEQKIINELFNKYQNTTTNSGPAGTVLAGLYRTNITVSTIDRKVEIEQWIARFQYTNFDAHETISFGKGGIGVEFRTKANDGYDAALTCVGDGTLLHFTEIKQNLFNGVKAVFNDNHPQGLTWDYRRANFKGGRLTEYRQYTNGMVLGKYFMWNSQNGNLMLEANFKEPYDFEKHMIQLQMR